MYSDTGPKTCALASIALLNSGVFGADAQAIAEEVDLLMMYHYDGADNAETEYLRVSRQGMRVALTRELRKYIWDIFVGCNAQVNLEDKVRVRDLTFD